MKSQELILYRNLNYRELFDRIAGLLSMKPDESTETMPDSHACAGQLVELAASYGFEGNLWHCFLAFCLSNNENAYSTSCEIVGPIEGTLNELAAHDFRVMKELFDCDIRVLDNSDHLEGKGIWSALSDYQAADSGSKVYNKRIRDQIVALAVALEQAEDVKTFAWEVTEFYRRFGVGKFGLNKAFRIEEAGNEPQIIPITNIEPIHLDDIIGYQLQKQKLIENTEAFLSGRAANNVLLFGDSGTGKSSSIKAILNEYYDRGLRIIEVYKHQFKALSKLQELIKDRNYKFIIYMDDLSFEDSELEYKYLKAIIEGGLGKKPGNVLIYATSNRRHLIREKFSDKRELDDDLHNNDTVQEKLSLVARFGVTIYYGSPDRKEFQDIVKELAVRYEVNMPLEELYARANVWELNHGGLSGRTASQFITHLLGKE
ncbi:ATP-binding protein [Clostridium sp. Marseille-P2415]|uniref:ATP-binding protein n=1 Tax=Clostridium sp. Marseille-P2415 TaxID=1805471 RepID=UPI0009886AB6|nr:ATP-binding protein [Clostridium sp. Marseille-P2415]